MRKEIREKKQDKLVFGQKAFMFGSDTHRKSERRERQSWQRIWNNDKKVKKSKKYIAEEGQNANGLLSFLNTFYLNGVQSKVRVGKGRGRER